MHQNNAFNMGKVQLARIAVLAMLLPVLTCFRAVAQEVGQYGFLEIPVSARASALGGCALSVVEPETSLIDQNPGLICSEMSGQCSLSYINYVAGINLGYASYAGRFLSEGAWACSARYVDYGKFDGYDPDGNSTGKFTAKDIVIGGSVGYPLTNRWNIGGTLRAIYSHYDIYSAFAIGVDVGVNWYDEASGSSFSAVVTNLGGQLKSLDDHYQHLPTQAAVGYSKEVEHLPVCVSLSAVRLFDWGTSFAKHLVVGAEWIITDRLYFAAGYNFSHFSAGGGFRYRDWLFQLSYARYNSLDGSLGIGISYSLQH